MEYAIYENITCPLLKQENPARVYSDGVDSLCKMTFMSFSCVLILVKLTAKVIEQNVL